MTTAEADQVHVSHPSQRLRQALNLAARALVRPNDVPMFSHPRLREIYPRYLLALYPITHSAIPLITAARDAVKNSSDSESPLARALIAYYDKRIPEETGHDEWVLEDMARLGFDPEQIRSHVYPPSIAALIGSQYYYINYGQPVAFLGWLGALEGFPPVDSMLWAAAERTGYPIECFRTLRKHGNLDIHHRDDLNRFLDSAPLSEADVALVITNAIASLERASQMIREVIAGHPMLLLPGTVQPTS